MNYTKFEIKILWKTIIFSINISYNIT